MKKVSLALLLAAGLLITTPVKAMTEAELKDKLTSSYTINGVTRQMDSGIAAQVERYLEKYEVSSGDCDYIAGKIDAAIELIQKGKATKWSELTASEIESLISMVNDISNKTSVKASLSKGGVLVIYESDGKTVFTKISGMIKDTDNSMSMMYMVGATISLVGLLVIVKKVVKANA